MGDEIERDFFEEIRQKKLMELSCQSEEEKNLATRSSDFETIGEPFNLKIKIKILIVQNTGILLGFSFMLFMALFSEKINL
jgi:hypothetical protein